jgi:uncharacterized membrane protein
VRGHAFITESCGEGGRARKIPVGRAEIDNARRCVALYEEKEAEAEYDDDDDGTKSRSPTHASEGSRMGHIILLMRTA